MPPSAMIAQITAPGLFMTIHLLAMAVQTMPGKFTTIFTLEGRRGSKLAKIGSTYLLNDP